MSRRSEPFDVGQFLRSQFPEVNKALIDQAASDLITIAGQIFRLTVYQAFPNRQVKDEILFLLGYNMAEHLSKSAVEHARGMLKNEIQEADFKVAGGAKKNRPSRAGSGRHRIRAKRG